MQNCLNCKYWKSAYKTKKIIGTCSLLSSLKGGLKSYAFKTKKLPCEFVFTEPTFGCNNFIKKVDAPSLYNITYFNDTISNNKSDYTVNVDILATDEVDAIKKAAIQTDLLSKEFDLISKITGSKQVVINSLLKLGFHFKEVKLKK
jgi:hypothetical protein